MFHESVVLSWDDREFSPYGGYLYGVFICKNLRSVVKMNQKVLRLVTSGVLIALGTVLSMIKVFDLPYGGSITLFSMVPLMVLGYMYGIRWGLLCGFVFGVLQGVLGATTSQAFAGLSGMNIALMAFLDYIAAFMVLGLAGMFKKAIKKPTLSVALGAAVAGLLRYVCHFFSGYILWGSYAEWFFGDVMQNDASAYILNNFTGDALAMLYSLIYNASYMLPEIVIAVAAIIILMSVKPVRKQILSHSGKLA